MSNTVKPLDTQAIGKPVCIDTLAQPKSLYKGGFMVEVPLFYRWLYVATVGVYYDTHLLGPAGEVSPLSPG